LTFLEGDYNFSSDYDSAEKTPGKAWFKSMLQAEETYKDLLSMNWSAQKARSVLPNSLKTEVVVTANFREWLHILKLRCSKAAHPQMREVMLPLLADLYVVVPIVFDDLYNEYANA
jgi:thymidylate synthase (FAD)